MLIQSICNLSIIDVEPHKLRVQLSSTYIFPSLNIANALGEDKCRCLIVADHQKKRQADKYLSEFMMSFLHF